MDKVRPPAPRAPIFDAYDPQFLPADAYLAANENPCDIPDALRKDVMEALKALPFNRYPDPLANALRDAIAQANGIERSQVLVGNGGDELLFDLALAYGGPGRRFLNFPPTFSVYEINAHLTRTEVIEIPRRGDFTLDEEAVCARLAQGDIDYTIVTSPNNPTGDVADPAFILRLLEASDALVLVDEAYFEFCGVTCLPLLERHRNLAVLRTFSKAYSLAGVRLGYIMAHAEVIRELVRIRQPYSVDAVSQLIGACVLKGRSAFAPGIAELISQRELLYESLAEMPAVTAFPSQANYILVRVANASELWQTLYDQGVLVRDLSRAPHLKDCLRITVGTAAENQKLLAALGKALGGQTDKGES
ncbi:MAG: histidinol-phosphate transaminase [Coriobacteriaceae bacterium]|jgi:histidinol-phosphate aminotransferase|nr:histidinol-phosphate transaminase [Coriobacteriaceae bacterium]